MRLVTSSLSGELTEISGPKSGGRRFGIPPGGPMDPVAFAVCRLTGEVVYELRWGSCQVQCSTPGWLVVVQRNLVHQVVELQAGTPTLVNVMGGLTAYFALSAFTPPSNMFMASQPVFFVPSSDGPQTQFTMKATPDNSRMGVRLSGYQERPGAERASQPAEVGTMQLTPDGTVLVIGPDGPTIGGYRQLGTIARCSRWQMAHWLPGEAIEFVPVSVGEARTRFRQQQAMLRCLQETTHQARLASE